VTGTVGLCVYQSCLWHTSDPFNETYVTFTRGVHVVENVWQAFEVGTVTPPDGHNGSGFPFTWRWANRRWAGHPVVMLHVYHGALMAQSCSRNTYQVCTFRLGTGVDLVENVSRSGKTTQLLGVRATDAWYAATHEEDSQALAFPGTRGAVAVFDADGDPGQLLRVVRLNL
jgi:hypothetical protein